MKTRAIKFLAAITFLIAMNGCTRVGPGYTGFKYSYGGSNKGKPEIQDAVGWVGYTPGFSTVIEFPTSMQHWEGEVVIFCKLGASIKCKVGYNYKVIRGRSADVYFNFKTDDLPTITNGFLFNTLRNTMNNQAGIITLDSFISNTPSFRAEVDKVLTDSMLAQGFEVSQFGFTGAPEIMDASIASSVHNKIKAKQDAEASQQQLQISVADANKKMAEARGDSASKVINGLGDAKAIQVKQAFLTPEYVEYIKWSKWDGKLPTTQFGTGANVLLNR